jgi:hypothetical protein
MCTQEYDMVACINDYSLNCIPAEDLIATYAVSLSPRLLESAAPGTLFPAYVKVTSGSRICYARNLA